MALSRAHSVVQLLNTIPQIARWPMSLQVIAGLFPATKHASKAEEAAVHDPLTANS